MGGPIFVVLSDIYVCKMEEDIVAPSNPLFCKRYMDDTNARRKINGTDELFNALNSYHQNIKLTLELDIAKFLYTEIIRSNGKITTQVYQKMKKLPVHWTSKIPVRYKGRPVICNFIEKRLWRRCFPVNFAKFLRAPFLQNTSGRLLLYKCNAIIDESHKAKKITSNFDIEIKHIVIKYTAAGFPSRFVHSIIDNFDSGRDSLIIPQWLFE